MESTFVWCQSSAITRELAVDAMRPTHHPTQVDGATTLALEGGEVIPPSLPPTATCSGACVRKSVRASLLPPPSLLARDRLQLVISDNPLQEEEVRVTAHTRSATNFDVPCSAI